MHADIPPTIFRKVSQVPQVNRTLQLTDHDTAGVARGMDNRIPVPYELLSHVYFPTLAFLLELTFIC